jgi:hypothetical protein
MTIEQAKAITHLIEAWVGWEMWELQPDAIRLDGSFTLEQLQAVVTLMIDGAKGN